MGGSSKNRASQRLVTTIEKREMGVRCIGKRGNVIFAGIAGKNREMLLSNYMSAKKKQKKMKGGAECGL